MRISDWSSHVCSSDLLPCWPGPYSRLLIGLFDRPQRLRPSRRSILCLEFSRLDMSDLCFFGPETGPCRCPSRSAPPPFGARPDGVAPSRFPLSARGGSRVPGRKGGAIPSPPADPDE